MSGTYFPVRIQFETKQSPNRKYGNVLRRDNAKGGTVCWTGPFGILETWHPIWIQVGCRTAGWTVRWYAPHLLSPTRHVVHPRTLLLSMAVQMVGQGERVADLLDYVTE